MSGELKKLKKDLAIDEYLKLIKEDHILHNSYISLAQYMYFLENKLQQAEEVIEEVIDVINEMIYIGYTYEKELRSFFATSENSEFGCRARVLKDILNKYKKEESR